MYQALSCPLAGNCPSTLHRIHLCRAQGSSGPDFHIPWLSGLPYTIDDSRPQWLPKKSSPRQLHYRMNQFATPKGGKMSPAPELKATLTLPQTAFPMKANLPQNEPLRLARWASLRLYYELRKAAA